jgi:hypothetical protein
MSYTPYLVANFASGVNKRLQPWLLLDDAQEELLDGYVFRGVMSKRPGYNYYADGLENGQPYTESRIVNNIPVELIGTGDFTTLVFDFVLANLPIRRGTVVVSYTTGAAHTAVDDGLGLIGHFTGVNVDSLLSTIDYTTGAVHLVFTVPPAAVAINANYDYFPDQPVMMIANFITSTNQKQMIVADESFLNIYDPNFNILRSLSRSVLITGISNANPGIVTAANHGLVTGDSVFISGISGMTQVNNQTYIVTVTSPTTFTIVDTSGFGVFTLGSTGLMELVYTGSKFDFFSWVNYPDQFGNPRLLFSNNVNQIGYYAPTLNPPVAGYLTVGDYVNYPTPLTPPSPALPYFFMVADDGTTPITTITAAQLVVNQDRLLMLRTTENGVVKPHRIRISGMGAASDDFRTSATGAGTIDIPDASWIQGASFNRGDLIIFTELSTWVLQYTGDDTVPFKLKQIDESRGSDALFSVITYLNRTTAISPRGMIQSDGYKVERQDEELPDFSFNEIDQKNFALCFAGNVDEDRDHYLLYPQTGQPVDDVVSTRILVTNYEEDNFSFYRLPLSCMGTFVNSFDITWNDLLQYPNWAAFAADYGNWNSFAYSAGSPISIGGGHHGEIWRLNVSEQEDNPVRIRNITKIDSTTIQVTTDWNNYSFNPNDQTLGADTIFLTGVLGMLEVNNQQYKIVSTTGHNVFNLTVPSSAAFSAYTSGGIAVRVIPFLSLFKQFNPFVSLDQKVRCGWLYMYVSTSDTKLKNDILLLGATQANPGVITTSEQHGLATGNQVSFFGLGGMTQLNDNFYYVTVLTPNTFSLNDTDTTAFTPYTSGGYVAIPVKCKAIIDVITNDNDSRSIPTNLSANAYQGLVTNLSFEVGSKKWYKVYINQVGKFIQFRVRNLQAGAQISIHAIMPGFQGLGRLV